MDTSGIRPTPQKITALKSLKELMIIIGPNISSVSLQVNETFFFFFFFQIFLFFY